VTNERIIASGDVRLGWRTGQWTAHQPIFSAEEDTFSSADSRGEETTVVIDCRQGTQSDSAVFRYGEHRTVHTVYNYIACTLARRLLKHIATKQGKGYGGCGRCCEAVCLAGWRACQWVHE